MGSRPPPPVAFERECRIETKPMKNENVHRLCGPNNLAPRRRREGPPHMTTKMTVEGAPDIWHQWKEERRRAMSAGGREKRRGGRGEVFN